MLMTHPHFSTAIVDSNMLAAIGMQQILADIMPIAEVRESLPPSNSWRH